MKRLRELVNPANPEDLYIDKIVIGEGASGVVFSAREKVSIQLNIFFEYHENISFRFHFVMLLSK
jgi:hypothetical protein